MGRIGKAILYLQPGVAACAGQRRHPLQPRASPRPAPKTTSTDIPEFFFVTDGCATMRHMMGCTAWSVLLARGAGLLCWRCFWSTCWHSALSLRKAGFYGTVVAALLFMLTTWFAVGERREMLDDTLGRGDDRSRRPVKSSPDKSSTDLFVLHEGTVVDDHRPPRRLVRDRHRRRQEGLGRRTQTSKSI